jgi:thioredoxin 1
MRSFICTNAVLLLVVCSALTARALESPFVSHEQTHKTTDDHTPENRSHEVSQSRNDVNDTASTVEDALAARPPHKLQIFHLKYADAESVSAILGHLLSGVTIVADQRLNAIIATGSPDDMGRLEAVLAKLDQPHRDRSPSPSPEYRARLPLEGAFANTPVNTNLLRAEYNSLEQQAARLAKKYRDLATKAAQVPGDAKVLEPQSAMAAQALKVELAMFVKQAFEARQELQQAELIQLRQRLARIEQRIATRQRIKGAIVDRRVAELLDPALRWEGDREAITNAPTAPQPHPTDHSGARSSTLDPMNRVPALPDLFGERDAARTQMEPLLLFFHAAWCPACQRLKPEIDKLRTEGLSILDVDVDVIKLRNVRDRFQVDTLPTLILFVDGREVDRVVGMEIEPLIERYRDELSGTESQPEADGSSFESIRQFVEGYATQVRLLELKLRQAELAAATAKDKYESSRAANRLHPGALTEARMGEQKIAAHTAALDVELIKSLLELHRKMGQTEQPQLAAVAEEAGTTGAGVRDSAELIWDRLGVKLQPLSREELPSDRYHGGMQITEIRKDSPAAKAMLQINDIIVGIHHWETKSASSVVFALKHAKLQSQPNQPCDVKLYLLRAGKTVYAELHLEDGGRSN